MSRPLHELSTVEVGRMLRERSLSVVDLCQHHLDLISAKDGQIRAFLEVQPERTLAAARAADEALRKGIDRGPLHGIPFGLKDIIDAKGYRTSCQSRIQPVDAVSTDSAVASRLHSAGAILIGKLNTWEFALDGPAFDLPFPPARNPRNLERDPGGSSSGCGAAVAAGFLRITVGTDSGGSIRYPASACGVVGLKPTYDLVSRQGIFPLSATLDHCGPIARSVAEAEVCLNAITAPAAHKRLKPSRIAGARLDNLRVGVIFEGLQDASAEERGALQRVAEFLGALGAHVEPVAFPTYKVFAACGLTILFAEAFNVHQRNLRERPGDYGELTYRRLLMGATFSASDLIDAYRVRSELTQRVSNILSRFDVLLTLTTLTPALPLQDDVENTILRTMQFDVTGNPALAIPCGFSTQGLPLSVQVAARHYEENLLLSLGKKIETQFSAIEFSAESSPAAGCDRRIPETATGRPSLR